MAVEAKSTCVELTIPCRAEFVGVARLALLGVASRMQFSYDQVEDIRAAVGEACTISVEWADRNGAADAVINLRTEVAADKLIIDVHDTAGPRSRSARAGANQDEEELGSLFISLMVDETAVEPHESGTHVRMVKLAGGHAD